MPNTHDEILDQCNLHLVYLGRGIFVTLTERDTPLQVIPMTDDVKLVIIGELTNREDATVYCLLKVGLGVAIYRPIVPQKPAATSTVTKPEPEDCKDPISSISQYKQLHEPEHLERQSCAQNTAVNIPVD